MITTNIPVSILNDPQYWRDRAEEMRFLAEDMHYEESKQVMLRIANDYERLAAMVLERLPFSNSIA